MDDFRFSIDIPVRFRDLDAMNHVNNATYATYFEQGRLDYFREVIGRAFDADMVVASIEIQFKRQVGADEVATVEVRVPELGNSSFPMEYRLLVDGEVAATGKTVQVCYDSEAERSRPIPDDWREAIVEYEGL